MHCVDLRVYVFNQLRTLLIDNSRNISRLWYQFLKLKMANEKPTTCSRSFKPDESFRSFVNVFMAMCLIACIISQVSVCVYIYHKFTRLDERIDNLGNIIAKIAVERSFSPIQIKQPWMKTKSYGKEGPYNKGTLICKVWLSVLSWLKRGKQKRHTSDWLELAFDTCRNKPETLLCVFFHEKLTRDL